MGRGRLQPMTTQSALSDVRFAPSARAKSAGDTPVAELDRAVAAVREKAREFARMPAKQKQTLLGSVVPRIGRVARAWVDAACRAKGISATAPVSGEEWLGGPMTTARNARLLVESLAQIAEKGRPQLGRGVRTRPDGRVEVSVFPTSGFDGVLQRGFTGDVLMEPGVDAAAAARAPGELLPEERSGGQGLRRARRRQRVAHSRPWTPSTRCSSRARVRAQDEPGQRVGRARSSSRRSRRSYRRGFLRVVYGGGEVGAYLVEHTGVDDMHITGSDRTHDLIVWGPPGPERERRKARERSAAQEADHVRARQRQPGRHRARCTTRDDELWFQARNVATMVAQQRLVQLQRRQDADHRRGLAAARARSSPGRRRRSARRRRARPTTRARAIATSSSPADATASRSFGAEPAGRARRGRSIRDVDAAAPTNRSSGPSPSAASSRETSVGSADPVEFLAEATRVLQRAAVGHAQRLHRHRSARARATPRSRRALDRAIARSALRHASPSTTGRRSCYGSASPPWGGHPSATLADIQSGLGWVHNTFMLEGIDKAVLRGPLVVSPKPAWFYDNAVCHLLGERMSEFEAAPTMWKIPGIAMTALRG